MAIETFRQPRTALRVSIDVWKALFVRETIARISQDRLGPVWLFLEPILYLMIMVGVRSLLGRTGRLVPGADFIPWLIIGILAFLLFRNLMTRGMTAVNANQGLFAYRQVKPIDTVISRFVLESLLKSVVFIIFVSVFIFLGYDSLVPDDPLYGVYVWFSIALLGLGVALVLSVVVSIIDESQRFISLLTLPLLMLSGVIFPVQAFPIEVRTALMWNPVLHAIESMRMAIFSGYHSVSGIDLVYVQQCAIVLILFGLMLHIRFKMTMVAK